MPMNLIHRRLCSSQKWADKVAERMPAFLDSFDLGDDVLEIGPGFGATTRAMVDRLRRLTCVEIDPDSVRLLKAEFDGRAEILLGDGADLPFPDGRFSAVVCFTMLHHVPSPDLQNRIFAEAARVLRPGGVFAGVDSQPSLRFRMLHIGDTMVVLDPATLAERLRQAGLTEVKVGRLPGQVRFTTRRAPTAA
jgi:SAM-dependent methyltransferase